MTGPKPRPVRVTIDLDRCVGVGMCLQHAPHAFMSDPGGQSMLRPDAEWTIEELVEAADSCPMSAITLDFGAESAG
jgi:ferredoxin